MAYGVTPSYDGPLTKAADENYTYTFEKWNKDIVPATEDTTYVAIFKPTAIVKPTPTPTPTPTPSTTPSTEPSTTPSTEPSSEPSTQPSAEPSKTPAPAENPTPAPTAPVAPNTPVVPTPAPGGITVPETTPTPSSVIPSQTPTDEPTQTEEPQGADVIPDDDTPPAPDATPEIQNEPEEIADNDTPLVGGQTRKWALVNLILTILTVLASILLLIFYFGKRKKALEDEDGNEVRDENGDVVLEYKRKKKGFWRVFSLIPAIVSVIAFILTEDITLPVTLIDRWTLLMVIIALVQLAVAILCKKGKDKNDDDQEKQEETAAMA